MSAVTLRIIKGTHYLWPSVTMNLLLVAGLASCSKETAEPQKVDVPAMIVVLKSQEKEARIDACVKLARAGSKAAAATEPLIPLLQDEDPVVRRLAAYALGEIGPEAKAALPALKEMARDADRDAVRQVINSLKKIDP